MNSIKGNNVSPAVHPAADAALDELAELLARQKLVPFFGAGISTKAADSGVSS